MADKQPRALIIAIEEYPKAEGLSRKLEGTNQAGYDFCQWLVETRKEKIKTENIVICAGPDFFSDKRPKLPAMPDVFAGTTMSDIVDALNRLSTEGKDKTSDLFFFYSGHGFCWEVADGRVPPTDVLVTSQFRNRKLSGRECFQFSEIREFFWGCVGGAQHFFFTDACRTILKEGEIKPGTLGLTLDRAFQGTPDLYPMFSTPVGEPAYTSSGFAPALIRGLKGEGHAKGWVKNKMYVKFEPLQSYVRNQIHADVEASGAGSGLIHDLGQPKFSCAIKVVDADPADRFQGTFTTGETSAPFEFQGPATELRLAPADRGYEFAVSFNGQPLAQIDPPPGTFLDLFDPCALTFQKTGEEPAPPSAAASFADISLGLDPLGGASRDTSILLRNLRSGKVSRSSGSTLSKTVAPGDYVAEVLHKQILLLRHPISLEPGATIETKLAVASSNWLLDRIRQRLPSQAQQPIDALAKDLGPAAAGDASLWIALMGAAEIVNPTIAQGALSGFHLLSGPALAKGRSTLLVLAASADNKTCRVATGTDKKADWQTMEPVPELPGLFRFQQTQKAGPQLVSFRLPGHPAWSYASFALPNRATLLVLADDGNGRLSANQFLLPVRSLFNQLPKVVYQRLDIDTPRMVRLIARQQVRFESRERDRAAPEDMQRWDELLHGKWLDPILALIGAHQVVRSGMLEAQRPALATVEANMNQYFPGLPDTLVLSTLLGKKAAKPKALPLLRESLISLAAFYDVMPFPRAKLDHDSMWVCGRDAVK